MLFNTHDEIDIAEEKAIELGFFTQTLADFIRGVKIAMDCDDGFFCY